MENIISNIEDSLTIASREQNPSRWMFLHMSNNIVKESEKNNILYKSILDLLNVKNTIETAIKIAIFSTHWMMSARNTHHYIHSPYLFLMYLILQLPDENLEKQDIKKITQTFSSLPNEQAATMGWLALQIGHNLLDKSSIVVSMAALNEQKAGNNKVSLILDSVPILYDLQFIQKWVPYNDGEHIGDRVLAEYQHLNTPEAKMSIIQLKFQPISNIGIYLKEYWLKKLMYDFEQKLIF